MSFCFIHDGLRFSPRLLAALPTRLVWCAATTTLQKALRRNSIALQATDMHVQAAASSLGGMGGGGMGGMGGAAPPPRQPAVQQPLAADSPLAKAQALKDAGNKLHSAGSYQAASAKYNQARRTLGGEALIA